MDDKERERLRYEARAREQRAAEEAKAATPALGSAGLSPVLRAPYLAYEAAAASLLRPGQRVLELGAGTGEHTGALLATGARVCATDISPTSLELLARHHAGAAERLETQVADMEALPFADASFDVVASAGALSYGNPATVDASIRRVLRPGGAFLCVDSLNDNPVYRLNRWLHYRRGHRSRSTLERMPGSARIASWHAHFESVDVRYFGGLTWAMPLVARLASPARAASLSDSLDSTLNVKRSAFKFVAVARGRR